MRGPDALGAVADPAGLLSLVVEVAQPGQIAHRHLGSLLAVPGDIKPQDSVDLSHLHRTRNHIPDTIVGKEDLIVPARAIDED